MALLISSIIFLLTNLNYSSVVFCCEVRLLLVCFIVQLLRVGLLGHWRCSIFIARLVEFMRTCRDRKVRKGCERFRCQLLGREIWQLESKELDGKWWKNWVAVPARTEALHKMLLASSQAMRNYSEGKHLQALVLFSMPCCRFPITSLGGLRRTKTHLMKL